MKRIALILLLLVASAALAAAHPGWLQPGVVAHYDGYSAFVKPGGGYQSPAQMDIEIRVDSAAGGYVTATTTFNEAIYHSLPPITNTTTFGPDTPIGSFWVDDAKLQAAKIGDKIGLFTVKERGQVTVAGKTWNAVNLEINENNVRFTIIADERTGLMLQYAEVYPTEEIYIFFRDINTDLSGYSSAAPNVIPTINPNTGGQGGTPGGTQNGTVNPWGTGTQGPGAPGTTGTGDNGGNTTGTGEGGGAGTCSFAPFILILIGFGTFLAKR